MLQCRPITTIFLEAEKIYRICKKNINILDHRLNNSDKIKLRIIAEDNNLHISDAYLLTCNTQADELPIKDISVIQKSQHYRGYSVVILYPQRIKQKIVRAFIGNNKNIPNLTRCHRYLVRSLPEYDNLWNCLNEYYNLIRKESWLCSIIIQEIYDPIYTGILKKSGNKYVLEIAKGHFVVKGVVPMTTYVIDSCGKVEFRNEINQYNHIGILEGCTIDYVCPDDEDSRLVSIEDETIKHIVTTLGNLCQDNVTIEFGILFDKGVYLPYLIDCVKENVVDNISIDSISNGVLSAGKRTGKLVKLELGNFNDSLNAHFYNEVELSEIKSDEKIIFYADLPSIKFLDILSKYDPQNIGFVFAKGSLLCHLAVLLREKQIPAVIGFLETSLETGRIYMLDTSKTRGQQLLEK